MGQPIDFLPGQEADREHRFGGPSRTPGGLHCFRGLTDRKSSMIQESASGVRKIHASGAACEQRNTDFQLEITQLTAQRRLRRVKPLFCRNGNAALLGNGNEVTQVAELHRVPMLTRYGCGISKVFPPVEHNP